jgi:hypothetical protein
MASPSGPRFEANGGLLLVVDDKLEHIFSPDG